MRRITELLEQTSRTFAVGIRQLPDPLREVVSVAYLLLRVSDYFEDNERMSVSEKTEFLGGWAEALRGAASDGGDFAGPADFDDRTPDAAAAREATLILDAFRALPEAPRDVVGRHVVASTEGMAEWVARGPDFETERDLDAYMFEVAGRVGLLLTDLFALRSSAVADRQEEMRKLGVEFGLGLQTVNVIRGLSSDPERGWVFVPRSFLPAGGGDPARIWAESDGPEAMELLDALCRKARRHLTDARRYVLGIPRREYGIRVFCMLPLLFAVRTLELSDGNPRVYTSEVKLARPEVRRTVLKTRLLAPSNAWVRRAARASASGGTPVAVG